jgi:hypothetical protein
MMEMACGEQMAAALAAKGYTTLSAVHCTCEVSGSEPEFYRTLAEVVADLHVVVGDVILRSEDGTRREFGIRCGAIIDELQLPPARCKYVRPLAPKAPRHKYYGIAPVGRDRWRAVVNTTDPVSHRTHVIVGAFMDDAEAAAREHDRLAREFASYGWIGGRVHLNFPARIVTVAQICEGENDP